MLRSISLFLAALAAALIFSALPGGSPAGAAPPDPDAAAPPTPPAPPAPSVAALTDLEGRLRYPMTVPATGQVESLVGGGCPSRRNHAGIDISSPLGTAATIHAAYAGFATLMASSGGYGLTVDIEHRHGPVAYVTRYAHLSAAFVPPEGRWVHQHEVIGMMGGTGNAQIVHLHFELRDEHGQPVDLNPAFAPCRREVVAGTALALDLPLPVPLPEWIAALDAASPIGGLGTVAGTEVRLVADAGSSGARRR